MATVTYTLDLHDPNDKDRILMHANCYEYWEALYDIDQKCRNILKYPEDRIPDWLDRELEEIREIAGNAGVHEIS